MHQPLGEWVAEFSRVHAHPVAAYDLKTAAATAAALAKTHGWKLMAVYSRDEYYKSKQETK